MLCAAKCYWPGVSKSDPRRVAARAGRKGSLQARDGNRPRIVCCCAWSGLCSSGVGHATEHAGIQYERPMSSIWLDARRCGREGALR